MSVEAHTPAMWGFEDSMSILVIVPYLPATDDTASIHPFCRPFNFEHPAVGFHATPELDDQRFHQCIKFRFFFVGKLLPRFVVFFVDTPIGG